MERCTAVRQCSCLASSRPWAERTIWVSASQRWYRLWWIGVLARRARPRPPSGLTAWWGNFEPPGFKRARTRQLVRRGPGIQNSVYKVHDSTRIDSQTAVTVGAKVRPVPVTKHPARLLHL